jgi:DNA-binding beta-propeller fold protein YncE
VGLLALALVAAPMTASAGSPAVMPGSGGEGAHHGGAQMREVLAVSNNWDGTVDIVDADSFKRLKRIDIIPDREQRIAEIHADPTATFYYDNIRALVGEGHDQYADDAFTSADGRLLYVSRPSFADVVAIRIRTGAIAWRTHIDGYRADHMALSPDGRRLLVSASTARRVDVIDTASGEIVDGFASGDSPHESNYSRDGERIFHASIGLVYTSDDDPAADAAKGERVFEIVDAKTYEVRQRIDMGRELAEAGYPDMSSAVRPMTYTRDGRFVYLQVSFFHGFVEYDLRQHRVRRVVPLPESAAAQALSRQDYLLDSAHHGIAMNPQGTRLCVAGTMSDYAAIVSRKTLRYRIIPVGERPYWATPSTDGRYCFVSVSGEDRVAVISYKRRREVASIPVGDHPQRMRTGDVRRAALR